VADGYDKDVAGVLLDYMPSDIGDYAGTDFDLRITFGDDPLDTAFWVTVPGEAESLTLRQLIQQHLLGESRTASGSRPRWTRRPTRTCPPSTWPSVVPSTTCARGRRSSASTSIKARRTSTSMSPSCGISAAPSRSRTSLITG
jgi:hypothetical protein